MSRYYSIYRDKSTPDPDRIIRRRSRTWLKTRQNAILRTLEVTEPIRDKTFRAERVEIDVHEFNACRFENCELVITGRGPIRLTNCFVDTECHFSFTGYAGRTLESLTGLYAIFPEAVEPILAEIRGDGTTWLK